MEKSNTNLVGNSAHQANSSSGIQTLIAQLPVLLQSILAVDNNSNDFQKRLQLLSVTTATGSVLPKFQCVNRNQKLMSPNIYAVILGEPGSGKSKMDVGMTIMTKTEGVIKQLLSTRVFGEGLPTKCVVIPSNTSRQRLIQHLYVNGSFSPNLLGSTELDNMKSTLKDGLTGFSEELRKAFEHETINYSIKTGNLTYTIDHPNLSLLVSGTLDQVLGYLNVENGLFSRALICYSTEKAEFKDQKAEDQDKPLQQEYAKYADDVLEIYNRYNTPKTAKFSQQGLDLIKTYGEEVLKVGRKYFGSSGSGVAFRLAAMVQRMALILYACENYKAEVSDEVMIPDDMVQLAVDIVKLYQNDNFKVLWEVQNVFKDEVEKAIYDILDEDFTTAIGKAECTAHGFSERQFPRMATKWQNRNLIKKVKQGIWKKTLPPFMS